MASDITTREFLFAMWEGGGNVPPTLEVARKLLARGHRVRWIGDPCQAAEVTRAGAEFVPWAEAPGRYDRAPASDFIRDHEAADGLGQLVLTRDRLMIGPAARYARDLLRELGRRAPDLLVSSEMLFGAMIAAEVSGAPLVLLGANLSLFPLPGQPPMGTGLAPARTEAERARHAELAAATRALLNDALPALNTARRSFGLEALADAGAQAAVARRYLLLTSKAFDFAAEPLPDFVRYVGPQLSDPPWPDPWIWPWPASDTRRRVVVAFSTTFQNQVATVSRTVEAIRELPIHAVVTLGPALAEFPWVGAENVRVVASAPHSELFDQAGAVVTHGGHGTVMRALAAGLPLLCLPMGRDQADNAVRVTSRGAGLQLRRDASVAEIRSALRQLLDDPGYQHAAEVLGASVRSEAASSPVVAELEAAAGRSAVARTVPEGATEAQRR